MIDAFHVYRNNLARLYKKIQTIVQRFELLVTSQLYECPLTFLQPWLAGKS